VRNDRILYEQEPVGTVDRLRVKTNFAAGPALRTNHARAASPGSIEAVTVQPNRVLEIIWILWLISWVAASFWSSRAQKRAATPETWRYRGSMIAGGVLLLPLTGWLLAERPVWKIGYAGMYALVALMLAGLALTWWARIFLGPLWSSVITRKEDHKIIDTGPYAFVRHPIYSGLIIALVATAAAEGRLTALFGAVLIILGIWQKARTEERFLLTEFGRESYDDYRHRVPMLIPFLPRRS
jgi:protein-S-isoprenylcysteine O-methyltransferase Ste14